MSKNQSERFKVSNDEREIIKKIEILTQSVERVYPKLTTLMWRSFVSGIFVALGTTIGLSIVLALLTFIIGQLRFIPLVNDIIQNTGILKILLKAR